MTKIRDTLRESISAWLYILLLVSTAFARWNRTLSRSRSRTSRVISHVDLPGLRQEHCVGRIFSVRETVFQKFRVGLHSFSNISFSEDRSPKHLSPCTKFNWKTTYIVLLRHPIEGVSDLAYAEKSDYDLLRCNRYRLAFNQSESRLERQLSGMDEVLDEPSRS